jgi:hypothetical protein
LQITITVITTLGLWIYPWFSKMSAKNLIATLCRTNIGMIQQKLDVIDRIDMKHGTKKLCDFIYNTPCSLLHASIGQHIRHSIDHIDRATTAAMSMIGKANDVDDSNSTMIHYDLRVRGTNDEHDVTVAKERMTRLRTSLVTLIDTERTTSNPNQSIHACFMLSGDDNIETCIPSTIARELSFAAHHAIHHCAMIKIIVTNPNGIIQLSDSELPMNFGRAPSTINFENRNSA